VVDEKTPSDLCTGVNFDAGEEPCTVRKKSPEKLEPMRPEKMSATVAPEGM
jgi:hypothetical protein